MTKSQALAMLEFISDLYRIASGDDSAPETESSTNGWHEVELVEEPA